MRADIPGNEKERLASLRAYEVLDTLPERAYDDIARLASFICQTPISLITLLDEDRQWFKATQGWDGALETSRDLAFCAHAILEPQQIMLVADASRDARFADNELVTRDPDIRFYAGAPLITSLGEALGTLCVIDRVPRTLSPEQQEALQALSRQVMDQLEGRRRERAMHEANVERDQLTMAAHAFAAEVADLYNNAPCGYHSLDTNGVFARINDTELHWLGYELREILDKLSFFDIVAPARRAEAVALFEQLKTDGQFREMETDFVRKDGTIFPVLINATAIFDDKGHFSSTRCSVFDISGRKQTGLELQRSEARFHAFMDNGPVMAFMKDAEGRMIYVNRPMLERFDKSAAQMLGQSDADLWPEEVAASLRAHDLTVLSGDSVVTVEENVPTPDGASTDWLSFKFPLREPDGSTLLAGMAIDITERKFYERQSQNYQRQLEAMVSRLEEIAVTDSMTGLKNKGAFETRIREEWQRSQRYELPLTLLSLDVDHFKQYNDSFGHPSGDEVLKQVAEILNSQARPSDFAARTGGEEFSLILTNTDSDGAFIVAERLRRAIESASWPQRSVTASIGIASVTPQLADVTRLIECADRALYDAKQKGRNRVSRDGSCQ